MIEQTVYFALGFVVASLAAMAILPAFWHRAYRLTRRELESQLPLSLTEVAAERDQLRAQFAVERCQLEQALEDAKAQRQTEMSKLGLRLTEIADQKAELGIRAEQIGTLSDQLAEIREQLSKSREELRDRDARLAMADKDLAALNQSLRVLTAEKQALQETLDTQRGEIGVQKTNLDAQTLRIAELDKTGRDLKADLTQTRDELRTAQRSLHDSEKDRLIALRKLESAEQIAERRAELLTVREAELATAKQKGAELYKSVKQLEAALKAEAKRGTQLQKQVDDRTVSLEKIKTEGKQTLEEVTATVAALRVERQGLQADLTEARAQAARIQRELNSLKRANGVPSDLRKGAQKASMQK